MKTLSYSIRVALMVGFASLSAISTAYAAPVHVAWAESLVTNLSPDKNEYGSGPTYIDWSGVNDASAYANRTQCSSFVTGILKQSYSWSDSDFRSWFGYSNPTAEVYHDTIEAQNGFSLIQNISDIQSGDIIAIKYLDDSSVTGHVMIAKTAATVRVATLPIIDNTLQYEIEVMDSSYSGHGVGDTRLMKDGTWDSGAGIGKLRLYADDKGAVIGYSWSVGKNSIYYRQQYGRHLVVGRLAH